MTEYRADLPERPARITSLPLDERGFPIPWFVAMVDGKPDFRVIRPGGVVIALHKQLCWLCGGQMGTYKAFVVGPMCGVNRVSSEPPLHLECAKYAATACPFLTRPLAVRRERDLPEDAKDPAGVMIKRNPGVTLVWVTRSFQPFRVGNGLLIRLGDPTSVHFYREGRPAHLSEVMESVRTGMPLLAEQAQRDGAEGIKALKAQAQQFAHVLHKFYPQEAMPNVAQ